MSATYKFLGSEITLPASANTVSNTGLVRLTNSNTATAHVITQKFANTVTKAVFSVLAQSEVTVVKLVDDTLQVDAGSDVKAVGVAYTN
jgi:hypothetical protein